MFSQKQSQHDSQPRKQMYAASLLGHTASKAIQGIRAYF